jgi:hypothetical protein
MRFIVADAEVLHCQSLATPYRFRQLVSRSCVSTGSTKLRTNSHASVTYGPENPSVSFEIKGSPMLRMFVSAAAAVVLASCATTGATTSALERGKFVAFDCEGQAFQARLSAEGNTVRVRTQHGAAELSPAGESRYSGDGFTLHTKGSNGIALEHGGKLLGKNCKRA